MVWYTGPAEKVRKNDIRVYTNKVPQNAHGKRDRVKLPRYTEKSMLRPAVISRKYSLTLEKIFVRYIIMASAVKRDSCKLCEWTLFTCSLVASSGTNSASV